MLESKIVELLIEVFRNRIYYRAWKEIRYWRGWLFEWFGIDDHQEL